MFVPLHSLEYNFLLANQMLDFLEKAIDLETVVAPLPVVNREQKKWREQHSEQFKSSKVRKIPSRSLLSFVGVIEKAALTVADQPMC